VICGDESVLAVSKERSDSDLKYNPKGSLAEALMIEQRTKSTERDNWKE